jgi:hypothetical protein
VGAIAVEDSPPIKLNRAITQPSPTQEKHPATSMIGR